MVYLLMHKDVEVLRFCMSMDGRIEDTQSIDVINSCLMPLGTKTRRMFIRWMGDRFMPSTRSYIASSIKGKLIRSSGELFIRNMGLSMTDCYWIKPAMGTECW